MSKGSKVVFVAFTQHCIQSNVTHLTHVERVESVLGIKWPLAPPKYAVRVHNIVTHNFLNIQRIFNPKKFWKAETETFPTIPLNAMYVERVKSYFDFRPLRHASTYIAFMVWLERSQSQLSKTFFELKIFVP